MADIVGLPPLEVFAMDEYMNRLTGSIPYTSLQWNRKYYEPGTFEMVVPVTVYDPNWAYIYCDDRPETGIVQKVEYTDSSTVAGGIDTVTVSGFFMEQLLNDYTFLVEETEEQEMKIKKAQPARNKMPELFTDENGKLISVSSWYLHGEQYFDYRDVATGEKLSPEQVSDNRTYIELTPDDGYEAITYPILDANGQQIGEWTAGLYQSSYDYYKDDDNTFHKVDAAGNDTVVDNVVSSWLAQGGGSVIYKDDNGDYRWIGGVVTDVNDTYYRQAESWERLVSNTNAEIVYTTDGQYAVYMVEVKGAWQLRTDIGEVGVPTDNVQTIVKWAQRAFGNSLVYDEPKVTGVKKVLEPTFKRMGDMFFEELQTIGASVRLFYSFGANQTVFQIWQGFDRTQGSEWEDEPIEQPKALAARALAVPDALNYSANADEYTGATPSTSGNVGDAVIVSQCLFSVPDAEFAAWNTSPSGSGTTYHPGDSYTLTDGDDVLYAQWNYADPEPGENGRKAPFCTFSDTWGSMWGASASRDISNYRNLCYLLYEYDEPNWDDEGHPEVVKDLKSQQWYIPYTSRRSYEIVRLEDDARDQETYLDRRSDKPPGDQDWPRDAQDEKPDVSSVNKSDYDAWFDTMKNDARAMLINDYPIVNNVNTGTLRQTGYLHDFDLGDLVDLAIDAIGMKKTARIIGVDEVYESGNSEIHLEMGEELVTVFKKSQLAQLGG